MAQVRSGGTDSIVETVLLSAAHGQVWYRVKRAERGTNDPDTVARWLACLQASEPAGLLHSTSWRFEAGRIVLTYAALPDPDPGACLHPVPVVTRSASAGPLAPSPESVPLGDVARHACRHLAYLHRTDRLVACRADAAPQLWTLIDAFEPAVAELIRQPRLMELPGEPVHIA
jgi:hypothetical protein